MRLVTLGRVVAGGERGSMRRFAGVIAGVAVGVALLLLILSAYSGLGERTARTTWASSPSEIDLSEGDFPSSLAADEVVVAVSGAANPPGDYYLGESITRIDIAAAEHSTVDVPGVGAPPAPGGYYASPALAKLIDSVPADELGDRFGTRLGIIGDAGIPGPESLVAVVGTQLHDLDGNYRAALLTELRGEKYPSAVYEIVALVGGIAVLLPVLVLISIVTKLGQSARRERFSAIRLIGATPGEVAAIASLEAVIPAFAGAILGIGLFWAVRPLAALMPIEGSRFFVSDLQVAWPLQLLIAVGVAVIAASVAYITALRAGLGPLGGSREQVERKARWYSLIPLIIGLGIIVIPAAVTKNSSPVQTDSTVVMVGFLLIALGLLFAGPYLSAVASRIGARTARTAAGVLAMNRIVRHPRAIFRSVSGLVLALFVVTVFAVAATTETEGEIAAAPASQLVPQDVLSASFNVFTGATAGELDRSLAPVRALPEVSVASVLQWIDEVPGDAHDTYGGYVLPASDAEAFGISVESVGDSGLVWVDSGYFSTYDSGTEVVARKINESDAALAVPSRLMVMTDGSPSALERARTTIEASSIPLTGTVTTRAEDSVSGSYRWAGQYVGLAWMGILIAVLVSVVSLSVSTVAGMIDRKRQIGLLRLGGMPASTLRRMTLLETAVPFGAVFLLSIGLGFATGWGLVVWLSGGDRSVTLPDASYLGLIGICLALAAVALLVVFRSVRSEMPLAATRFE